MALTVRKGKLLFSGLEGFGGMLLQRIGWGGRTVVDGAEPAGHGCGIGAGSRSGGEEIL